MEHLPAKAGSATIALTAMLVSPNDAAFVWVGSLECVIQTTSKDELARYIGTVIGRDLASKVEKSEERWRTACLCRPTLAEFALSATSGRFRLALERWVTCDWLQAILPPARYRVCRGLIGLGQVATAATT